MAATRPNSLPSTSGAFTMAFAYSSLNVPPPIATDDSRLFTALF